MAREEFYLGIDLGGSHISAWRYNIKGIAHNPFVRITINTDITGGELIANLAQVIQDIHVREQNIVAIGLASPGPLDVDKGVILSPPNFKNIGNLEVVTALQVQTGLPVYLLNDADAAVLGELWLGPSKFKNMVMLTLGTGVGGGIIANGRLQTGRGMGGEWGHTTIRSVHDHQDRLCSCGRLNCLEAFCGAAGFLKTCQSFNHTMIDLMVEDGNDKKNQLMSVAESDEKYSMPFEAYCRDLVEGILNIISVQHPECVILGGGMGRPSVVKKVKEIIKREKGCGKLGSLLRGVEIKIPALLNSSVAGAAKHALDCREKALNKFRAEYGIYS